MSCSLILCKMRIKITTTIITKWHCGCGIEWEKEGFSRFLEDLWKPTWLGFTPDCWILLGKFEGGGQDHHRHFLGRIYMRWQSVDVVQTGNVRLAISSLSISYSRYYMRTYCVEGLYWVWKYGNDADPGTASKNPVQQRGRTSFKSTVSGGAHYRAPVGVCRGSPWGVSLPWGVIIQKILRGHDTCDLGQITAPHWASVSLPES